MPVKIRCPNPDCGKAGNVADDRAGQSVRCPHCKTVFTAAPAGVPVRTAARTKVAGKNVAATLVPGETAAADDSAPNTAPPMPATIGRFVVRAFLGSGACGNVYRAFDPDLERDVALKVPHAEHLNPTRLQRFLIEAKATARLRHPHIVPVYETGVDREHYYIVSAFIDGHALADAIDEGPLDFRQAAGLVRDLAEALAHAHANGIVHRDVKPGNIMLDKQGQAYLTDFGLARQQDGTRMTRIGSFLGTPGYMAPEMAKGTTGDCNPACDQYSLGAVLYELLCGQPPFSGPPEIVLFNVVNTPLPLPNTVNPKVPAALEAICVKALAKQPGERFADCGQLAEALRSWLAEQKTVLEVAAERQPSSPRHGKPLAEEWWRSKPFLIVAAGTIALVGLIGVLVLVLGGGRNSDNKETASTTDTDQRIKMLEEELKRLARKSDEKVPVKQTAEPKDVKKDPIPTKDANDGKEPRVVEKPRELPPPLLDVKDVLREWAKKGDSLPETPFSRADNRRVAIGEHAIPVAKDSCFVVTRPIGSGNALWTRLGGSKVKVETGCTYVSLPGFRSDLLLERGLLLSLVGNVPEFDSTPVMESAVDLHRNDSCVDLTLLRGRIVLTSVKDAPIAVRVRFENPNNRQPVFADVLLLKKGTCVVVDRFGYFPLKASRREPPQVGLSFLGVEGKATIRFNDASHQLTGPPGKTILSWASEDPSKVDFKDDGEPGAILTGTPVLDKLEPDLKKHLTEILNARSELSLSAGTRSVDVSLAENLLQKDPIRRMLVVRSYAALGYLDELIATLENGKLADAHAYAISSLEQCIRLGSGNEDLLSNLLTSRFSAKIADKTVDLLRGNVRNPTLLVDNLNDDNLLIRQLSYYNLIGRQVSYNKQQMPYHKRYGIIPAEPIGQSIPYDPVMLSEQRMAAQQQWRALLKKLQEDGPKK